MHRNTHLNRLIILGSLSSIVVALWIGGLVYRALTSDKITPQVEQVLEPLDPNLDTKILDQIQDRREIVKEYPQLPEQPTDE